MFVEKIFSYLERRRVERIESRARALYDGLGQTRTNAHRVEFDISRTPLDREVAHTVAVAAFGDQLLLEVVMGCMGWEKRVTPPDVLLQMLSMGERMRMKISTP